MYTLNIEAGSLSKTQWLSELRSCAYYIDIYSEQADGQPLMGRAILASANDRNNGDAALFVQDENLNAKINAEFALLKLELSANKAVITEAN